MIEYDVLKCKVRWLQLDAAGPEWRDERDHQTQLIREIRQEEIDTVDEPERDHMADIIALIERMNDEPTLPPIADRLRAGGVPWSYEPLTNAPLTSQQQIEIEAQAVVAMAGALEDVRSMRENAAIVMAFMGIDGLTKLDELEEALLELETAWRKRRGPQ